MDRDALQNDDLTRGIQDPHLAKMFQLTGEAKVASVCEYIEELIEAGIKFLIFGHHVNVLNAIEDFVSHHKLLPSYIRIDGSTPAPKRKDYVNQFQTDPDCKIAILSITAAGTGLTLTAASHVVMAELHWTPAVLVQSEDRIHRIGQVRLDTACELEETIQIGAIAHSTLYIQLLFDLISTLDC